MNQPAAPATRVEVASWCHAGAVLLAALLLRLLPALIAGLLVYELVLAAQDIAVPLINSTDALAAATIKAAQTWLISPSTRNETRSSPTSNSTLT